MKKTQLKQLIKEEIFKSLNEKIKYDPNQDPEMKGSEAYKREEWKGRFGSMDGFDKAHPQFPKPSDGMDDDMREFRSLLDSIDGQQSELEYVLRQVSLEDPGLEMQLEDALVALETVITEI